MSTGRPGRGSESVTYVTVSSSRFFPGCVALHNSLRLTGNEGDLVVLDWDLRPQQRALLERHATVVSFPGAQHPMLLKPAVHRLGLRGTVVFVDADMIVTASLAPIVERARAGGICLFPDHASARGKWFAEWQDVFALAAPPRRQPYANAGFLAFSVDRWPHLLARWADACARISPPWPRGVDAADQDALNAILMSELPGDALDLLPEEEAPLLELLDEVEVLDERRLAAALNGRSTSILHYVLYPKAWDRRGWLRIRRDAYVTLLLRSLWWNDVPLRLSPRAVPLWLRPGAFGGAARGLLGTAHGAGAGALRLMPVGVRRRVLEARDRLAPR